ncbi:hypothetical protein LINGRAHAP2_LOCUS16238 [Linum grandiflorum]
MCLVTRFVGEELSKSDWDYFFRWTRLAWGVQVEERHALSDDLWLLKFPVKEDVDRVVRLGRWTFRKWTLEADRWFPFAGSSRVMEDRGVVWLKVLDIPVHLRSPSLFRRLGDYCGSFLSFAESGCSWNEIWIKVRLQGVVPRWVPVSYKEEVFPVKIMLEDRSKFVEGWKGVKSQVFVRIPERAPASERSGGRKMGRVGISRYGEEGSGVGEGADKIEGDKREGQKRKKSVKGGGGLSRG